MYLFLISPVCTPNFTTLNGSGCHQQQGAINFHAFPVHILFVTLASSLYILYRRFHRTGRHSELKRAWDRYSAVFKRVEEQVKQMPEVDLLMAEVSPKLRAARDLQLAIPGTYTARKPIVPIVRFSSSLRVIESKHHPRKLSIFGADGRCGSHTSGCAGARVWF